MDLPLVSIVTPSLNQGRFIERTLESVRRQRYPRIEHIVVDGGSRDCTLDVLRRQSPELRWVTEPDRGQSDAINKGFRMAKGDILAYLNSDDTYAEDAMSTAISCFVGDRECVLVYGCSQAVGERDEVLEVKRSRTFSLRLLTERNYILQSAVFFRREVLETVGDLDTTLHYAMDYDFWLRVGSAYPGRLRYLPRIVSSYRVHPGAKSVKDVNALLDETRRVLDRYFARPDIPDEIAGARTRCRGRSLYRMGERYYDALRLLEARRLFVDAIKVDARLLLETNLGVLLVKSWVLSGMVRLDRARNRAKRRSSFT